MVFTDWKFFVFFAVVFLVYWALPFNALRKLWLLLSSVLFYAAWDWRLLPVVLLVIANAYVTPLLIVASHSKSRKNFFLTLGIVISLSTLAYFKYFNFFVASLSHLIPLDNRIATIVLPIGISFYTFHSLSYMVDVYRGRIAPTWNFVDVALYILFFPQLVAGPIVRAPDLLPQMRSKRAYPGAELKYFLLLFLIGYFKKALLSDNLSPYVDLFYATPEKYAACDALIAILLYSVQIYCDFSGYTDMAIATAGMLGFRLKQNFNHPYLAFDLVEFWRRWHISLSSWLRDYLYIPLGGNRGGWLFRSRNVMITMLLGGLWHGASWTFVLWGGLHGIGLIVCQGWRAFKTSQSSDDRDVAPAYSLVGNGLTFAFVAFSWAIFRATDFQNLISALGRFTVFTAPKLASAPIIAATLATLLLLHASSYRLDLRSLGLRTSNIVFAVAYGAAIALMLPFINTAVKPFIYFQF